MQEQADYYSACNSLFSRFRDIKTRFAELDAKLIVNSEVHYDPYKSIAGADYLDKATILNNAMNQLKKITEEKELHQPKDAKDLQFEAPAVKVAQVIPREPIATPGVSNSDLIESILTKNANDYKILHPIESNIDLSKKLHHYEEPQGDNDLVEDFESQLNMDERRKESKIIPGYKPSTFSYISGTTEIKGFDAPAIKISPTYHNLGNISYDENLTSGDEIYQNANLAQSSNRQVPYLNSNFSVNQETGLYNPEHNSNSNAN